MARRATVVLLLSLLLSAGCSSYQDPARPSVPSPSAQQTEPASYAVNTDTHVDNGQEPCKERRYTKPIPVPGNEAFGYYSLISVTEVPEVQAAKPGTNAEITQKAVVVYFSGTDLMKMGHITIVIAYTDGAQSPKQTAIEVRAADLMTGHYRINKSDYAHEPQDRITRITVCGPRYW